MDELLKYVSQYFIYLVFPVIGLGLSKWKDLDIHFRLNIILLIFSGSIGVFSLHFKSYFWYFLNALIGVVLYGLFFKRLLNGEFFVLICVWAGLVVTLLVWFFLIGEMKLLPLYIFIPYDLFIITFCMIYISQHFKYGALKTRRLLLFLVLLTLSDFCFNLGLDILTYFLTSYLSDNFIHLLWDKIVPLYTVVSIILMTWIILCVRPGLPELKQMPDLDS